MAGANYHSAHGDILRDKILREDCIHAKSPPIGRLCTITYSPGTFPGSMSVYTLKSLEQDPPAVGPSPSGGGAGASIP